MYIEQNPNQQPIRNYSENEKNAQNGNGKASEAALDIIKEELERKKIAKELKKEFEEENPETIKDIFNPYKRVELKDLPTPHLNIILSFLPKNFQALQNERKSDEKTDSAMKSLEDFSVEYLKEILKLEIHREEESYKNRTDSERYFGTDQSFKAEKVKANTFVNKWTHSHKREQEYLFDDEIGFDRESILKLLSSIAIDLYTKDIHNSNEEERNRELKLRENIENSTPLSILYKNALLDIENIVKESGYINPINIRKNIGNVISKTLLEIINGEKELG